MNESLRDKVVVVIGASSGIGRATALAFAGQGAHLVLAARREQALREVADEIGRHGVRTLVVPTDVTDVEQVNQLAAQAIEEFGRIDVWVNDAGVSVIGRFHEVPLKDVKRVLETNVFGVIYGARAVLPIFLEQHQGTLINVSSVVSSMPQPYASAYVASKAAVRALSASLRQELYLQDAKDVHVVTILPAVIDTPFFQSAANYMGRNLQPPPPANDPEVVARAIVGAAVHPRREVFAGRGGRVIAMQMKFMPATGERMFAKMIDKTHFGDTPILATTGNLFSPPANNGSVSGGWGTVPQASPVSRTVLASAGLGVLGLIAWRKMR